MSKEVKDQIDELKRKIVKYSHSYYMGINLVTDPEFDALVIQLQELEEKHPEYKTEDSPTQVVGDITGSDKSGYKQAPHHVPMLSLNTQVDTSKEPIKKFLANIASFGFKEVLVAIEYKYDGLGLDLQYVDGELKAAVTRGDGMIGEDVLHLVEFMGGEQIPLTLPKKYTIDVRGEIYINVEDFALINKEAKAKGKKEYANPRNLAAGLLRRHDPVDTHYFLRFGAYDAPWGEGELWEQDLAKLDHLHRMAEIKKFGFNYLSYAVYAVTGPKIDTPEAIEQYADLIHETYLSIGENRPKFKFEIDGVVYKATNRDIQKAMGFTGREPNWAIAHKFPAPQVETEVLDVLTQTGRTGRITPVAKLAPVLCGGVVITSAILVNEDRIKQLGLSVGNRVVVQRAGDVIPEVVSVVNPDGAHLDTLSLFSSCPSCGGKLEKEKAIYYCRNISGCDAQLVQLFTNAVGRTLLNIKGLGESTIERLVETEDLKNIADIFKLNEEKLQYAGVAKTLTPGIMQHVKAALALPAYKLLAALGINMLGVATATDLLNHFKDLDTVRKASVEELVKVRNISTITAQALHKGFDDCSEVIDQLLALDHSWAHAHVMNNGLTVAVTGSFKGYTRHGLESGLQNAGFTTTKTISDKLDAILVGDGAKAHKVEKAKSLNVPIATASSIDGLLRAGTATILALKDANAKKDA